MARRRYVELDEGQWHRPVRSGWRHACCDCGRVHAVDFRLVRAGNGRRIVMRWRSDRRATAAMRRALRKGSE